VTRPAYPHVLAGAACVGLALSVGLRVGVVALPLVAAGLLGAAAAVAPPLRLPLVALALVLGGWWWGSARLDALERSVLHGHVGEADEAVVVVTGPPRETSFRIRAPGVVHRFGRLELREAVLLELPRGRSPPQGAVIETMAQLRFPNGPSHGFDERAWLAHKGVHVVMRVDRWRRIGRRHGLGGVADRLHRRLQETIAPGLGGERRAVLEGVVLGDDAALPEELRKRFRSSGLYHLLAVSGQNVALIAGGSLMLAWLAGLPRWLGEVGALVGMAAYVLAVGPQPSVIRAGIAGALGSLAWLAAQQRDRWHFLLLGALALLAWNPYALLDPGFQLSFAAVAAIFAGYGPLRARLEGYPVPGALADVLAVSAVCGAATAPIVWLQFHAVPLLSVPANVLAAPAMAPLLVLALVTAGLAPIAPTAAGALAWLNGWTAAYLAFCARLVGGLPGAQIRSTSAALVVLAGALLLAAYAWDRWRPLS
jgi:competence protein ComEC